MQAFLHSFNQQFYSSVRSAPLTLVQSMHTPSSKQGDICQFNQPMCFWKSGGDPVLDDIQQLQEEIWESQKFPLFRSKHLKRRSVRKYYLKSHFFTQSIKACIHCSAHNVCFIASRSNALKTHYKTSSQCATVR